LAIPPLTLTQSPAVAFPLEHRQCHVPASYHPAFIQALGGQETKTPQHPSTAGRERADRAGLSRARKPDRDKAIADYREAIRLAPKWTLLHINLGELYRSEKSWDAAIAEFSQAIELEPSIYALHARGMAHRDTA
jgi:tetratricopeptide (TPR) repeat protein